MSATSSTGRPGTRAALALPAADARDEIVDQIHRYCRALDRMDAATMAWVFHPSAVVTYPGYTGPWPGFVEWVWELHSHFAAHSHQVTNIMLEATGAPHAAMSESYVTASLLQPAGAADGTGPSAPPENGTTASDTPGRLVTVLARYLDRWSYSAGRWAIDDRRCIVDIKVVGEVLGGTGEGRRDDTDASYRYLSETGGRARPSAPRDVDPWCTYSKGEAMTVTTHSIDSPTTGASVPFGVTRADRIPAQRYYAEEFYRQECEQLWPRVWQMACRLEEIPNPGDYVEYEILDRSVILVRVSETEVKALHNACRHRGVKLVEGHGSAPSGFTCPFHGWCYDVRGRNTFLYQASLFADHNLAPDDVSLQPCRVERWGGCAFINFDDAAPSLRECLEPFASTMDLWHAETLHCEWWLSFRLPVNWKLAIEAFMEGYHVMQTHPQLLPPSARGRNAVYGPGRRPTKDAQAAAAAALDDAAFVDAQVATMRLYNEGFRGLILERDIEVAESLRGISLPSDPEERTLAWRTQLNDAIVAANRAAGRDMPDLSDLARRGMRGQVLFGFPNFFLLPQYTGAGSYRVRPLGPEECLFELWSLSRYAENERPPRPTRPEPIDPSNDLTPPVPRQDFGNLPLQQRGLHAAKFDFMRLSEQVEGLISNFHRVIDGYLGGVEPGRLTPALQLVNGPIDAPIKDLGF